MVVNNKVVDTYLTALLVNKDAEQQRVLLSQVVDFSSALLANQNVWLFLNSPLMSSTEKQGFLENFSKKLNSDAKILNLFQLLVRNKRLNLVQQYIDIAKDRIHKIDAVTPVLVVVSQPFDADEESQLTKKLNALGFSNIELSYSIDPTLIFGFKLIIDSKIYDSSLKSVFEEFKDKVFRSH